MKLNIVAATECVANMFIPFVCQCVQKRKSRLFLPKRQLLHHFRHESASHTMAFENIQQLSHRLELQPLNIARPVAAKLPVVGECEIDCGSAGHKKSEMPESISHLET